MASHYLLVKLLHIAVAVIALGTSAGLGIILEFYGSHPVHGSFVLRAIERITMLVVLPGYVLMLVTGIWLASLAWSLTANWIMSALMLWIVGVLGLISSVVLVRRQRQLLDSAGLASTSYRRTARLCRAAGAFFGIVVVLLMYLMVFKP
jgi:uncharacterized membrane protein